MQYRDIEIKIVQMGARGGWKWTVMIDEQETTGSCPDREEAQGHAGASESLEHHLMVGRP